MWDTDWEEVVRESEAKGVRVSRANETWQVGIKNKFKLGNKYEIESGLPTPHCQVATSLPRQFVVPAHVTDDKLAGVAGLGFGTRPPVWVGAESHFGFWF